MTAPASMQEWEIEILNFLRPFLKDLPPEKEDGTWTPPPGLIPDLTHILYVGREWLTHEARKKEVRAYRRQLEKALSLRDASPALKHLFPAAHDFKKGGIHIFQHADALSSMIEECDKILGTNEPKRYPRREIVRESLILWTRYTGRNPQRWALQPSAYLGDQEASAYSFCRLILTAIEGNDPGDFRRGYESAARSFK
jgi:hypothetical protein